jgi:Na+-translocating ferredoxin:NAD+ oxidoreductase subunit B
MELSLLVAVGTMGGLGLLFAAILAFADRKLHVEESPLMIHVMETLPQANCGACGAAGCQDFAVKLLDGKMGVSDCPIGGQAVADRLAEILEVEAGQQERLVVRLMCKGGNAAAAPKPAEYFGPESCQVQALVSGGSKICYFGCLGGGDCVAACKMGAIAMNADGLPEIYESLCTGCGLCVLACPRGVLEVHPIDRKIFVLCKNQDEPRTARQVCTAACIGCGICARASAGAIEMQNNLAVIDYDKLDPELIPFERCKTQAIHRIRM